MGYTKRPYGRGPDGRRRSRSSRRMKVGGRVLCLTAEQKCEDTQCQLREGARALLMSAQRRSDGGAVGAGRTGRHLLGAANGRKLFF